MGELKLKSLIKKRVEVIQVGDGQDNSKSIEPEFYFSRTCQKWATDITEFKEGDKKLYLSSSIEFF